MQEAGERGIYLALYGVLQGGTDLLPDEPSAQEHRDDVDL